MNTETMPLVKHRSRNAVLILTLAGGFVVCAGTTAHAQYPARTVRLVVPFTPGGSTDLIGRFLTQKFTQLWGTQVIVDNRPGAGGTLGAELVARAAPDGHTWLLAGMGALAISPHLSRKLPYESESSFNLMMPAGTPMEIVTRVSVETGRILSSAESRERIEQFGARPAPSTPAELQARIRAEYAKWGKLIRDLRLNVE